MAQHRATIVRNLQSRRKASDVTSVVIVGGGHNALTAAAYLARAGVEVTVLERLDNVGGAAKALMRR